MLKFVVTVLIACGIFFISNTNGFFLQHGEKCQISVFKGGKEFGGEKIMANKSFVPYLKTVAKFAKTCKVKVHVTESYKQLKTPTDFVLNAQIPLAVGRGIRFDLQNPKGGTVCNKLCMTTSSWKNLPEAQCFINGIQKSGIVLSDTNLLNDGSTAKLSLSEANKLKEATQKLCAPKSKT